MSKYDKQIASAQKLIKKFGLENATVLRFSDSGYDPLQDTRVNEVKETYTTDICFVPWIRDEDIDWGVNSAVEDEQTKFLIPAGGNVAYVPRPSDRIVTDVPADPDTPSQNWWSIERVTVLAPDTSYVLFTGVVTRGRQPI